MQDDQLSHETLLIWAGVGKALSAWNVVEFQLGRVFCQALDAKNFHPVFGNSIAARAYWDIESIEVRRKMVESVIREAYPQGEYFRNWKKISNKIQKLNVNRNKVAHGTLIQKTQVHADETNTVSIVLEPFYWQKNGKDGRAMAVTGGPFEVPLTRSDLVGIEMSFVALAEEICKFSHVVFKAYNPNGTLKAANFLLGGPPPLSS